MKNGVWRLAAYYLLPPALLAAGALAPSIGLFRLMGNAAFALYTVILFVKPVAAFVRHPAIRKVLSLRRELGVAMLWLYLFHSMGMTYLYGFGARDYLDPGFYVFWGAAAGLCVFLLGITSNDYSLKKLKKNWKRLHLLAFPGFYAALVHTSMVSGQLARLLIFGGGLIAFKWAEGKKRRQGKLPGAAPQPVADW